MATAALAAGVPGQHHGVAHPQVAHRAAHRLHDARPLVAEHHGQRQLHGLLLDRHVRMADAHRHNAHPHLVGAGRQHLHFLKLERPVGGGGYRRQRRDRALLTTH